MKRADTHKGYVWGVKGDDIIIALQAGGRLQTRNTGAFDTGDKVAVIFDISHTTVLDVRLLAQVEIAIHCGSDPIFEAAIRDTETLPTSEEDIHDGDICEQSDDILYCGG